MPKKQVIDLQHGAFEFCQQMKCPVLIKPEDCKPDECVRLDEERMRLGAIYLLRQEPSEEADFVTMLPGRDVEYVTTQAKKH